MNVSPDNESTQAPSTNICTAVATVMRRAVNLPASPLYDASLWVGEDQKRQAGMAEIASSLIC